MGIAYKNRGMALNAMPLFLQYPGAEGYLMTIFLPLRM